MEPGSCLPTYAGPVPCIAAVLLYQPPVEPFQPPAKTVDSRQTEGGNPST
jgi:hypothetical protein